MSKLRLITITSAACLLLICYSQYQHINQLKTFSSALQRDKQELLSANASLTEQYQLINEALIYAAQQKFSAEQQSSALRNRLKQAQSGNDCAAAAVPAELIRLQREAIEQTNHLFNAAEGVAQPLPAP